MQSPISLRRGRWGEQAYRFWSVRGHGGSAAECPNTGAMLPAVNDPERT